ncbi:MAG TPA: metal-dependent hydrolase [Kofleriaceae bacterium]|nr:metal-dependent hydrolase [Kofleriaceae bacterium]
MQNTITPRKAPSDTTGVPKHWFGGNPVATHIANGVNMLFPAGERFFVRSVNHYLAQIDSPELRAQIKGFFGQEGRHAKAHDDYNQTLRDQGFEIDRFLDFYTRVQSGWLDRITPPALKLASTAAAEHYTAIMAEGAFTRGILGTADPRMRELLMWHAAEEIEHKSVAFDVLKTVNPSYALRMAGLAYATIMLSSFWILGTMTLLRQEKMTFREIRDELRRLQSDDPIFRRVFLRGIREYARRDFHPSDNDNYHLAAAYFARAGVEAA